jgi:non-ribosomal peptide synthetase component E (peptide arylation enzyme)
VSTTRQPAGGYVEEYARSAGGISDEYLGEKICVAVVFSGSSVALAELNIT